MATPNQPKTMSSRLMTMKFMQRGSASPSSSPGGRSEPPSKKQRLSSGSYASNNSSPKSEAQAMQDVIASGEKKRQEAVDREGLARGETKWYLSVQTPTKPAVDSPLRVVSAGYGALDQRGSVEESAPEEGDDDDIPSMRPSIHGRRSFGRFNRKLEKQQDDDVSSSSSDDSQSEEEPSENEDLEDDPTGAKALIAQSRKEAADKVRAERKEKRKADKAEGIRLAEDRRKKHVNLNKLTSISGGKQNHGSKSSMVCHKCGEKGHAKADCQQSSKRR